MQICVTGMHRSGTSLLAGLFHKAGVSMGENLLGAGKDNPHGFFEDADVMHFHNNVMLNDNRHFLDAEGFEFEPERVHEDYVVNLISNREKMEIWGWKDPRTVLFLDFWRERLRQCKFVFVYRSPIEVLKSLLTRRDNYVIGIEEGLNGWIEYNRRILAFYQKHPERCILGNIKGIIGNFDEFGKLFTSKFVTQLPLNDSLLKANYHPKNLQEHLPNNVSLDIIELLRPECKIIYRELQEAADFPERNLPPAKEFNRRASDRISPVSSRRTSDKLNGLDLKLSEKKGSQREKELLDYIIVQRIEKKSPLYRGALQMWASLLYKTDMNDFFGDYFAKLVEMDKEKMLLIEELQTYKDAVIKIEPTLKALQDMISAKDNEIAGLMRSRRMKRSTD